MSSGPIRALMCPSMLPHLIELILDLSTPALSRSFWKAPPISAFLALYYPPTLRPLNQFNLTLPRFSPTPFCSWSCPRWRRSRHFREKEPSWKEKNKIPRMSWWRTYDEGSGFKLHVLYCGSPCGGLGTSTQTVFRFGFFFYGGCVLADWSPPSSRVASISASSSCRVNHT